MLPPLTRVRSAALRHHVGLGSIRPQRHVQVTPNTPFGVKMRCASKVPRVSWRCPSTAAARRLQPAATALARPARGLRNSVKVPASTPQKHMPATGFPTRIHIYDQVIFDQLRRCGTRFSRRDSVREEAGRERVGRARATQRASPAGHCEIEKRQLSRACWICSRSRTRRASQTATLPLALRRTSTTDV